MLKGRTQFFLFIYILFSLQKGVRGNREHVPYKISNELSRKDLDLDKLGKLPLGFLKRAKYFKLHFVYHDMNIECQMSNESTVFSKRALKRIKIQEPPKTYKSENCVLTFIGDDSFDGLAIANGTSLHFKSKSNAFLEVETGSDDLQYTCETLATPLEGRSLEDNASTIIQGGAINYMNRKLSVRRWDDCYEGVENGYELGIGIAVGSRIKRIYRKKKKLVAFVQSVIAAVNLVYEKQMNIKLKVQHLYIKKNRNWDNKNCKKTIKSQMMLFRKWKKPSNQAIWHLLDNCYPRNGNTVGIAYLKSLCTAYNTGVSYCTGNRCDGIWLTLAHEIGHNFGAYHSFEEGVGTTGGIMDYGDGKLNGEFQFNTKYRKDEICKELKRILLVCPHFKEKPPTPLIVASPTKEPTSKGDLLCGRCQSISCNDCLYDTKDSTKCFNFFGKPGCISFAKHSASYFWCGDC